MFILVLIVAGIVKGEDSIDDGNDFADVSVVCSALLLHQIVIIFGLLGIIVTMTNIIKAEDNAKALGGPC